MAAAAGTLEADDLAGNSKVTGTATNTPEEGGLGRGDVVRSWEGTGLDSMTGNHGNSAACCMQDC